MREILKIPVLTANGLRMPFLFGLMISLSVPIFSDGCRVKEKIEFEVPPKISQAKTAAYDELLDIVKNYEQIRELSSNDLKVGFTYGKRESGKLEKYRDGSGYILLRRPDSIHLVIQNPLTKTQLFNVLSVGNEFKVWYPRENKFYVGDNRAKELVSEDLPNGIPFRGTHIYEAIFPQGIRLDLPELRISMEEATDETAKYYVLSIYKEGVPSRIYPVRKFWIERSELVIARQQVYLEDGRLVSDIHYSDMEQVNGFLLPLKILIDRPVDGYELKLEFKSKSWRINNNLPDEGFILNPPEGAELIYLKEKVQNSD